MSHLKTDWLCIATEGDTVDGRQIYREWVIDMGETYNAEHYGALIWPEHQRDWGNYGEVAETMWQDGDDGLARLYAKIIPNMNLIYANQGGQLVYFSVEPEENFRGSGKTYLSGLAVTDQPASVGTTRLRFSTKKRSLKKQGYYACEITDDGMITQETKMKKPWQELFGIKPKKQTFAEGDGGEGGEGGEVSADEVLAKLQALAEAVDDIDTRLKTVEGNVETIAEVVDTEEFASLRENLPTILTNFSKLDKKVTKLPQRQFGDQGKKGFKFL
ncbi:GPO family capsid scaffolding protein [Citrobacter gillenii]|uniref:GPO family capsid scaffolding protein n=1 Tax=Citrobacter gillenii TaxID=67828 RepID=UPI0022E21D93|nr:GPO family capsid scaffolding protein [Citrobacter gillenii]